MNEKNAKSTAFIDYLNGKTMFSVLKLIYTHHILSGHAFRLQERLEMSADQMQHKSAMTVGRSLLRGRSASV